jgi:hypothetical protein
LIDTTVLTASVAIPADLKTRLIGTAVTRFWIRALNTLLSSKKWINEHRRGGERQKIKESESEKQNEWVAEDQEGD